jgi:hypothetical protein
MCRGEDSGFVTLKEVVECLRNARSAKTVSESNAALRWIEARAVEAAIKQDQDQNAADDEQERGYAQG